ncbi:MAG: hypothetical protein SNJ57_10215 [Cyanobacteriota bacterium]
MQSIYAADILGAQTLEDLSPEVRSLLERFEAGTLMTDRQILIKETEEFRKRLWQQPLS